jgi:hypothetical protein
MIVRLLSRIIKISNIIAYMDNRILQVVGIYFRINKILFTKETEMGVTNLPEGY